MAEIRGATFQVEGLRELQAQFERIGKMPKKHLTKAAKAGSNDTLAAARAGAPKGKTGTLKKGIHRKMETPNKRNKAVYRIRWNPKYTEQFEKPSSGRYGGTPPTAYYPQSVEYGFKTAKGRKEGQYFVKKAIEQTESVATQKVVDSLRASIDELTR